MDTYFVIVILHILVGFFLVFVAAKTYEKTKYLPMLYLTFGFFLIVIGDTILDDLFNIDKNTVEIIEELTEVSGFILVIIAVIKS